ncbi:MAG: protoheme IX farnesyltransferase, partial [Minisyncoccia bacterium]
MLRDYYELAKPGIVYGNAVTTLAAFLYASRWQFSVGLFLATMVGIMLVIGSACVFNNYLDRDIDAKMTRTKARALASGKIGGMSALTYASALGVLGLVLLYVYTNALTAVIALSGWILYVLVYTPAKRRTPFATLIGAVPGAVPIVVGYTAALGRFDLPAIVLFFSLVLW